MTTAYPTKVLLATDGSEDAALAARIALEIAGTTGSELHVAYVEYLPSDVDYEMKRITESVIESKRKRAEGFLDTQTRLIEDAGGSVAEAHLRMGSPEGEIVTLAEEVGAGLIVLGSRGLGGVRRALMGSVSDFVVRHAHCPVLVARRAAKEGEPASFLGRILVATDGSREATLALESAVGLTTRAGSELHVVTVGGEYHPGYEISWHPALLEETRRELEREARRLLDEQVKTIEEAGATVANTHLAMGGPPDQEIIRVGEEVGASLIVLGSRGRGPLRRALMGSVSDSVVRLAHCPVLVVREDARFREEAEGKASS